MSLSLWVQLTLSAHSTVLVWDIGWGRVHHSAPVTLHPVTALRSLSSVALSSAQARQV